MGNNRQKIEVILSQISNSKDSDFEEDDFTEEEIDSFFAEENMQWKLKEEIVIENILLIPPFNPPF